MNKPKAVLDFWNAFCRSNKDIDPASSYDVWHFCDTRECANLLYKLVLSGTKRATTCLANDVADIPPREGQISIVTDFDGDPKCIIRLTDVQTMPFADVDEAFAFDEGEGDRSLKDWREGHTAFFTRRCDELGIRFNPQMPVICQRFEVLFPKPDGR